jgi:hypothetical protein
MRYAAGVDLTEQDIQEFAEIWEKEFGEKLSLEQARHEATRFLELCKVLACRLPGEE